jgi:hypothetical protein
MKLNYGGEWRIFLLVDPYQSTRKERSMSNEIKSPKVVGCLLCGFRTDEVEAIKEFQLNGCKCSVRAKREWENNCCEGCFQPLRDCLCDEQVGCGACGEMISVEDQDENGFHDPEFCGANDEIEGE